jgi:hypothetical protein
MARTGREAERPTAESSSEALGGLPFAHEQAAAYCERLDISLADYGKRFQTAPVRLLDGVMGPARSVRRKRLSPDRMVKRGPD